jgi:hypothetical protein
MFAVTEAEAAAIRTAFEQYGEFAAAVELRRLCPGVTDNAEARECARTIAAWKPLPARPVGRVDETTPRQGAVSSGARIGAATGTDRAYTDWDDGSGTNTDGEILYRRKNVGALSAWRYSQPPGTRIRNVRTGKSAPCGVGTSVHWCIGSCG